MDVKSNVYVLANLGFKCMLQFAGVMVLWQVFACTRNFVIVNLLHCVKAKMAIQKNPIKMLSKAN